MGQIHGILNAEPKLLRKDVDGPALGGELRAMQKADSSSGYMAASSPGVDGVGMLLGSAGVP